MKESEGLAALPRHGHGGAPEYAIRPAHGRDVDEVLTLWALAYPARLARQTTAG